MKNELEKKYGLATAICMVVGIVIGSGVFFKAETVLIRTGGNMPAGILAWIFVGLIMVVCSNVFANMANRYENAANLVDYGEAVLGERYGYNIGWFMATIYTPALASILAWVSARYTCALLGWDAASGACMTISALYMCGSFALNALSPKLAGKFQVSTTFIKMIPLILMALVGTFVGLTKGGFTVSMQSVESTVPFMEGLTGAVVSVAFACEGWILATSINGELVNAKRNMPLALFVGSLIVAATYLLYYIGINGVVSVQELMTLGENGVRIAFQRLFGESAGTLVFVLIVISCLGTLNGLTLANVRGMYSMASKGHGPNPKLFQQVDVVTNMPTNSAIISLLLSAFWLLYFYGVALGGGWFGKFSFDSSELPIVTLYGMYIPMFINYMRINKEASAFNRFIMPALATVGSIFMILSSFKAYGISTVFHYLIVYAVFMIVGNIFYKTKPNNN
ncbi:MAG: APC family permease [Erysipelotrichales bacterium]|nr:APC family permease [Erysipelotrichales bacterium]